MTRKRGEPEDPNIPRTVGYFDPDLKERAINFYKAENISSMSALLKLAVEFYMASYKRSEGKVVRGFPVHSAVEPEEVPPKARDESKPSKRHRVS